MLEDHERTLVELCTNPVDSQVEECLVTFLKAGYVDDNTEPTNSEVPECAEDDSDCLVDSLYNLWANDLPSPPSPSSSTAAATSTSNGSRSGNNNNNNNSNNNNEEPTKLKPWSSRSSPSGTYVRDPRTGQMKNIGSQ